MRTGFVVEQLHLAVELFHLQRIRPIRRFILPLPLATGNLGHILDQMDNRGRKQLYSKQTE